MDISHFERLRFSFESAMKLTIDYGISCLQNYMHKIILGSLN